MELHVYRRRVPILLTLFLMFGVMLTSSACAKSSIVTTVTLPTETTPSTESLIITWTDSADHPTLEDVSYGNHERNVFDFWKARSDDPTPVLIYFHGGGFVAGDKATFRDNSMLQYCLDNGISVVAANYRFVTQSPFPAPFDDGAKVIQYIRWKAQDWEVDPGRIAAMGSSAGAGISIWIAVQDDLANANSNDPIARYSTRLACVVSSGGQTFYDPVMILENIGGNPEVHPSLPFAFGVDSIGELDTAEKRQLAYECSAIHFVSPDDPPLFLDYGNRELTPTPLPPDTEFAVSIHHPKFGEMMKEKYDVLGLECVFSYKGNYPDTETAQEFLIRHLLQ